MSPCSLHRSLHGIIDCLQPPSSSSLLYLHSSLTIEYEEEYEDVTVNQMLAPKSQETDATEILNNLLKEYDKKLRPDIGGNSLCCVSATVVADCKSITVTDDNQLFNWQPIDKCSLCNHALTCRFSWCYNQIHVQVCVCQSQESLVIPLEQIYHH